ncbi:hypothetical protein [Haloarcula sediminis]|uniref:hypothetical protein n=1 Tax=Haloarcula sediminis TaxID=3111777 RepID=UPI002D773C9A|nr:hypothetical protein [Haloarcula sp. CK38]
MASTHDSTHDFGSIAYLKNELGTEVRYVDDADLRQRIFDWLRRAEDLPGGDVMSIVDAHLTEIRQKDGDNKGMGEFPMRRVDGDGREDFPDSCKGCDHYGSRCPVFIDPVEREKRRIIEAEHADSDMAATKRAYRRYAEVVGCHQITEALSDRIEEHTEVKENGLDLLEETHVQLGYTDTADDAAQAEAKLAQEGR